MVVKKKMVSAMTLTLLLTSMLTLTFNIQPVRATGTVYIWADGSIDPPTAPITTVDGVTYTLTGNITSSGDGIIIQRDNIIVDGDGYTVQGSGPYIFRGIDLEGRSNVTIENTKIAAFKWGILLYSSSGNRVSGNKVTDNYDSIYLAYSSNNNISGNNVTNNNDSCAIRLDGSSNNTISGNNIINNNNGVYFDADSRNNIVSENNIESNYLGVDLYGASTNIISGNNIVNNTVGITVANPLTSNAIIFNNNVANNYWGILLHTSPNNQIYHNNFKNNTHQFGLWGVSYVNIWDDGYPSGGNYWSDYESLDLYKGIYQNKIGSDGIGDAPYVIDENNTDHYPLMKPYPWDSHDIGITYIGKVYAHAPEFPIIVPLKAIVGQGFLLGFNAFVMNYGSYTEVFNVTACANTTIIQTLTNITLSSGSSAILNFTWYTSGFAKGNYTISAYASPVQGETDTLDNNCTDGLVRVSIPGDVNGDGYVGIDDIFEIAKHFGQEPWHPLWEARYDITDDGYIGIDDIFIAASHFGQEDP